MSQTLSGRIHNDEPASSDTELHAASLALLLLCAIVVCMSAKLLQSCPTLQSYGL